MRSAPGSPRPWKVLITGLHKAMKGNQRQHALEATAKRAAKGAAKAEKRQKRTTRKKKNEEKEVGHFAPRVAPQKG